MKIIKTLIEKEIPCKTWSSGPIEESAQTSHTTLPWISPVHDNTPSAMKIVKQSPTTLNSHIHFDSIHISIARSELHELVSATTEMNEGCCVWLLCFGRRLWSSVVAIIVLWLDDLFIYLGSFSSQFFFSAPCSFRKWELINFSMSLFLFLFGFLKVFKI